MAKAKKPKTGIDDALANGAELKVFAGAQAVAEIDNIAAEAQEADPSPAAEGCMAQILVDHHEAAVADAVRKELAKDDCLFQRSGTLVRVMGRDPDEVPESPTPANSKRRTIEIRWPEELTRIQDANYSFVRERISACCYLFEIKKVGEKMLARHRSVPEYLPGAVQANPAGIRRLRAILPGPTIDGSGRLINTIGYDAPTQCYLADAIPGLVLPEQPGRADAEAAAAIIGALVSDFPFVEAADRSRWLALLLTAVARQLVTQTPLGLITANKAGSGKTRLAALISTIAHGPDRLILLSQPEGDSHYGSGNEIRKRLASLLHAGATLALIDNLPRGDGFGSPEIDAFLTASSYWDRKLGVNDGSLVGGPNRCLLLATGNAIHPVGDTADRTLEVLLRTDDPNQRSRPAKTFKIPELILHACTHRARYLAAALTIWKSWIMAGQPQPEGDTWGSFEDFASKVVAMVRWIGWPDPIANRARRAAELDTESQDLATLLTTWRAELGMLWVSAAEILESVTRAYPGGSSVQPSLGAIAFRDAVLGWGGWVKPPTVKRFGMKLASFNLCPVDVENEEGKTIRLRLACKRDGHSKTNSYRVEEVPGTPR